MIVIDIRGPSTVRQVTAKKDGKRYTFREQRGLFETADGERRAVTVGLDDDQADYPPGRYIVEPDSFFVDFGKFCQRRRLIIRPVESAVRPVDSGARPVDSAARAAK